MSSLRGWRRRQLGRGSPVRSSQRRRQLGRGSPVRSSQRRRQLGRGSPVQSSHRRRQLGRGSPVRSSQRRRQLGRGSPVRSSHRRRQLGRGSPVHSSHRRRQLLIWTEAQQRARIWCQEEEPRQQTELEALGPWLWGLEWRGVGQGRRRQTGAAEAVVQNCVSGSKGRVISTVR